MAHNLGFRKVEIVTNTTLKTAKAYSSVWDKNARFKEVNMTVVTKKELQKASFDHLILAAPTVDITNIDTSRMKPSDDTEVIKKKVETSCHNMIKIAEIALTSNSSLKHVTIMNHVQRFDTHDDDPLGLKPKLTEFANNFFLQLWLDSQLKNKIFIGSHTLECSDQTKLNRYVNEQTGRYDGVHMYGTDGKPAYTESVINIMISSFQTSAPAMPTKMPANDHKRCPQAKYKNKSNLKVENRFNWLLGN